MPESLSSKECRIINSMMAAMMMTNIAMVIIRADRSKVFQKKLIESNLEYILSSSKKA